jgi:hypothetical protein
MVMNGEYVIDFKEATVAYLKVISWHSLVKTEKNQERMSVRIVSKPAVIQTGYRMRV